MIVLIILICNFKIYFTNKIFYDIISIKNIKGDNMKKIITAIIAFGMTAGCTKEVQTLPANIIAPVTETTISESIPITENISQDDLILDTYETVEVYEKLTVADFVTETNVEILNYDSIIDTSKTGKNKISIKYLVNGKESDTNITYTVVDTAPPVLLNSGVSPYVAKDEEFKLEELVGYADNYDQSPTLTYDGTVDTSTIGSYPITAHVTDSSGNETSWDMTIIVLNNIPSSDNSSDSNEGTLFADFVKANKGENREFGIDVSAWQGEIDFNAVKNAGCDFVIIRMGHFYDEIVLDDWYSENIKKAHEAGLKVGVYFYTTLNSSDNVKDLASYIAEQLNGQKLDFPIAFDWEEFTTFQQYGLSIHDLNELFNLFCSEMESYNYSAMLYSSKNFLNNFWINEYNQPVWLAHFVDETDYTGDYFMWQGSCTGIIDGIDGYVDMNVLYND